MFFCFVGLVRIQPGIFPHGRKKLVAFPFKFYFLKTCQSTLLQFSVKKQMLNRKLKILIVDQPFFVTTKLFRCYFAINKAATEVNYTFQKYVEKLYREN